ncbi:hypothetical protein ACFXDJ_06165 [Streptomyces sp. NPDC059443]|uniref:hypothetical protein n=1 Tax=unclassified Streptomyces TaxID=2593676 RepID=UPI0036CF80A1
MHGGLRGVQAAGRASGRPVAHTEPYRVINLGTGQGTTVRELAAAFATVTGTPLTTIETGRRPGDSAGAYARVDLAQEHLGWKAEHSLEEGIRNSLRWYDKRDTVLGLPTAGT